MRNDPWRTLFITLEVDQHKKRDFCRATYSLFFLQPLTLIPIAPAQPGSKCGLCTSLTALSSYFFAHDVTDVGLGQDNLSVSTKIT